MSNTKPTVLSDDVFEPDLVELVSEAMTPIVCSEARKQSIKARLFAKIKTQAPAGSQTVRADEGEWENYAPGVDIKVLRKGGATNSQTTLWRVAPGGVIPEHEHDLEEECWVVEGELSAGDFTIRAGDYHVIEAGFVHPAITSKTGAMMLVRSALM